jgi:hypothetical protein
MDPLVASEPDHAPDAVHGAVAFVELHVIVTEPPSVIAGESALIVTVGGGTTTGFTVTVAEPFTSV